MSATAAGAPLPVERWKDRAFYTGMAAAVIGARSTTVSHDPIFCEANISQHRWCPCEVARRRFLSWVVLFLVQTVLSARRRRDLHRRLGIVGAVLAAAMVAVGTAIAIVSMRHNFAGGNERAL